MNQRIEKLTASLEESFQGEPWLGESVMSKLKSIDWQFVNVQLPGSANSIAILVQHILNWRQLAIEKLNGNLAYDIEMNSQEDWTTVVIQSSSEWDQLLGSLQDSQSQILAKLRAQTDDQFLDTITSGRSYSFEYLLEGIVQHDLYHLGQVGLLYRYALGTVNRS